MPRKSMSPDKPVSGNVAKYLCYREAWTRVTLASEQGFPFEAIAILESIIADRLYKYLGVAGSEIKAGFASAGFRKSARLFGVPCEADSAAKTAESAGSINRRTCETLA